MKIGITGTTSGIGKKLKEHYTTAIEFNRVDGIDISPANISFCSSTYQNQPSNFYLNNGIDLQDLKSDEYDFVMSTIVFQHICVHELRYKLKQEIFRIFTSFNADLIAY
jgi:hypothetical protein